MTRCSSSRRAVMALYAFAAALAPGSAAKASDPGEVHVTSLVGLENGTVRQCGVRVAVSLGDGDLAAEIALERRGRFTDLVVRATLGGGGSPKAALSDIRIEPRTAELPGMPPHDTAGGPVERRSAAGDPRITALIQELMIAGVVLVATRADGRSERIDIKGPLSGSVRAAYLNCAGDLYRPGE